MSLPLPILRRGSQYGFCFHHKFSGAPPGEVAERGFLVTFSWLSQTAARRLNPKAVFVSDWMYSITISVAEMDFPRRGGLFEVETLLSIIKDAIRPDPDKQYRRGLSFTLLRISTSRRATSARLCFVGFLLFNTTSTAEHAAAATAATAALDVSTDTKHTKSQNYRKP